MSHGFLLLRYRGLTARIGTGPFPAPGRASSGTLDPVRERGANEGPAVESATEVTDLLVAWRRESGRPPDRLAELVYGQLKRIARRQLRRERPDHTLRTTALVHEAYLRLVDQTRVDWRDRGQF